MKRILLFIMLIISELSFSQIVGKVTDEAKNPLPFVNIYLENTSIGTTSNEKGEFILNTTGKKVTVVFQSLGYKTIYKSLEISKLPYHLEVSLSEESYVLSEVVVSSNDNPANEIIRNAIKNKQKNSELTNRFEADFYSKGVFKLADVPKKIMGQKVGDMDGNIDSITRSGIVYQSETISKVKFEKPHKVKEHIFASKVAGNSSGLSFNTAESANFDIYDNYLDFQAKVISPIADNAFSYYRFTLESTFYDEKNRLINKIKITPKRDAEPVFDGYIYIVEDVWAVYATNLIISGLRMQNPVIDQLHLVQNYSFNETAKIWNKKLQTLTFQLKFLGIKINGNFSYVYNNYQFKEQFDKKEFKTEIRSFASDSNKKDSLFWEKSRQIPLTDEEKRNYKKKDSVELVRTSPKYLDSLDRKENKFKLSDILLGYSYRNSSKHKYLNYRGLSDGTFNSVQGFTLATEISYHQKNPNTLAISSVSTDVEYAFAEKRFRSKAKFERKFNPINPAVFEISGGTEVRQFNPNNPISSKVNAISSLFFKDNYMKIYNTDFLQVAYSQLLTKDVLLSAKLSFDYRTPLLNNTNYSFFRKEKSYTSNDPLFPQNETQSFENHYVTNFTLIADFYIKRRYISYPKRRIFVSNERYPSFRVLFSNTLIASKKAYQHQYLAGQMNYTPSFANRGTMKIKMTAGSFFNAENIQFIDYKHFNGNQTHVILEDKNDQFNLLPYYTHSTNKAFVTTHIQHHFKGFLMNKVPIINKLRWNLVAGFHQLNRAESAPYQEFSVGLENVGFGKFRFFRVDYVRSYQSGFRGDGFVFGLFLPISVEP